MANATTGNVSARGPNTFRLKYEGDRDPETGERNTRYVTFHGTRKEARAELARLVAEQVNGTAVDPSTVTVGEYVKQWLDGATHLAGTTRQRYGDIARDQIVPHLGRHPLQKLRPLHLTAWHTTLLKSGGHKDKPLGRRTVGHCHRLLRTILAKAAELELVSRNVASLVSAPAGKTEEVVVLSPAEVTAILTALAGHRLQPIVATFLGTGLRRGELCGLQWADIDLATATLKVERSLEETRAGLKLKPPKTKNGRRSMSLPSATVEVLRAHLKATLEQRLRVGL